MKTPLTTKTTKAELLRELRAMPDDAPVYLRIGSRLYEVHLAEYIDAGGHGDEPYGVITASPKEVWFKH